MRKENKIKNTREIKGFKHRFKWISEFFEAYLFLLLKYGINTQTSKNSSALQEIFSCQFKEIEKNLIIQQHKKLPQNVSSSISGDIQPYLIDWLRYIYNLEKQIWCSKKVDSIGEVGNPILLFYGLEIAATIFIGKDPTKTELSHKKIRNFLREELEKIKWNNIVFPFSAVREYKKWNVKNRTIISDEKFKILEKCAFGSREREFRELFYRWETHPGDKLYKKRKKYRKEKYNFYVYFYDLFYKYSESFRYKPIVPIWNTKEKIKRFNYTIRWLFSLLITFFEVLIKYKYKDIMRNFLHENIKFSKNYLDLQTTRWESLLELDN